MVNSLQDVIDGIAKAPRIGAAEDDPEGARVIQVSDTLAVEIIGALRRAQDDYEYAAHHADRGWGYLAEAVKALHAIATGKDNEGLKVDFFQEVANAALWELPTCGVYEHTELNRPEKDCSSQE